MSKKTQGKMVPLELLWISCWPILTVLTLKISPQRPAFATAFPPQLATTRLSVPVLCIRSATSQCQDTQRSEPQWISKPSSPRTLRSSSPRCLRGADKPQGVRLARRMMLQVAAAASKVLDEAVFFHLAHPDSFNLTHSLVESLR